MTTTQINQLTAIHHFDHDEWCVLDQTTNDKPMEVVIEAEDIPKIIETLAAMIPTPEPTEAQQAAQDSIHDLVRVSLETMMAMTYGDISDSEKKKLFNEVGDNLKHIDTLRRNC